MKLRHISWGLEQCVEPIDVFWSFCAYIQNYFHLMKQPWWVILLTKVVRMEFQISKGKQTWGKKEINFENPTQTCLSCQYVLDVYFMILKSN